MAIDGAVEYRQGLVDVPGLSQTYHFQLPLVEALVGRHVMLEQLPCLAVLQALGKRPLAFVDLAKCLGEPRSVGGLCGGVTQDHQAKGHHPGTLDHRVELVQLQDHRHPMLRHEGRLSVHALDHRQCEQPQHQDQPTDKAETQSRAGSEVQITQKQHLESPWKTK
ncbi:hypothetical protein D3C80_1390420 [compost metagenome]